jgi:hypothetical protein
MEVALVEIKSVLFLVGGEEQVDLSIVVQVGSAYAAAVVKIHIIKDVEGFGRVESIAEIQACAGMVQGFEQSWL